LLPDGEEMSTIKRCRRCRGGIVGIEAAIILIAFVIIAAALAYVVVNTGFFASQKSKDTIMRGISEAASALQLDGSVIGYVDENKNVTALVVPVKISAGREGVDVSNNSLVVTVWITGTSSSIYMPDIYNGTLGNDIQLNTTNLTKTISDIDESADGEPVAYMAIVNSDDDNLLESNEKGFLIIYLGSNNAAKEYDKVKVEVKAPVGASLIVEREIPAGLEADQFIDLR